MTKVFIGGSRKVARISSPVRQRLDRIIDRGLQVLVGDANGADKAVQRYLGSRRYERVEVFCTNGICRNNIGNWPVRAVPAPGTARGFTFYVVKDEQMTREASVGFMLWDGASRGTVANIERLLDGHKKVLVYSAPTGRFLTFRNKQEWEAFHGTRHKGIPQKAKRTARLAQESLDTARVALF